MLAMYYSRMVAAVFVLIGLWGITNVEGWAWAPSLYHLCLGLIFGYTGFFVRERNTVLNIVQGLGVLMVVVKGITLLSLLLIGQAIQWGTVEVSCFIVGIGSILAARYLRDS